VLPALCLTRRGPAHDGGYSAAGRA